MDISWTDRVENVLQTVKEKINLLRK
jgi:hypothetical protein